MTDDNRPDVTAEPATPEPVDPLVAWHEAMFSRSEMVLHAFEWQDPQRWNGDFAKPRIIEWTSTKTGTLYRSMLSDRWLNTRAVSPPAEFSADVWLGYSYMSPAEILQAIINRVRDYGHEL